MPPGIAKLKSDLTLVGELSKKYPEFRQIFSELNKKYISELNRLKKNSIMNQINQSTNKTQTMWNIINTHIKNSKQKQIKINVKVDGHSLSDTEAAYQFNEYFSQIGSEIRKNLKFDPNQTINYLTARTMSNSLFLAPVTKNEIENIILTLKNSQSAGYDQISNFLLKKIAYIISIPLTHVINLSINKGIFPQALKHADIVPIHKNESAEVIENYRPISLLSSFSKVFEHVINNRLLKFLEKHNLLESFQHGFTKNKSVNSALQTFMNSVVTALDKKLTPIGLFVDLAKAFDCVDHDILLKKLEFYGVRGVALDWFRSFLSGRTQRVRMNDVTSDVIEVRFGVPQGSVIGPTLFNLYVNDLGKYMESSDTLLVNYADDTNLLVTLKNERELEIRVPTIYNRLLEWFGVNGLSVNKKKTKYIIFKTVQSKSNIKLESIDIERVNSIKMLGTIVDENLSWNDHIEYISTKLSRTVYGIRSMSSFCTTEILRTLYFACFHSVARYGICLWGMTGGMQRLFILQKRVIRILAGLSARESCRNAFRTLQIMPLPTLYIYDVCLVAYKNRDEFRGISHEYNTRQTNILITHQHRTALYQKHLYFNCCRLYNKLSHAIRNSNNEKEFKRKLKEYLLNNVFYSLDEFLTAADV